MFNRQDRDTLQEKSVRWGIQVSKPPHPTVLFLPQITMEMPLEIAHRLVTASDIAGPKASIVVIYYI